MGPVTKLAAPVGPVLPVTWLAAPVGPVAPLGPVTEDGAPGAPVAPVKPVGPRIVEAAPVGPVTVEAAPVVSTELREAAGAYQRLAEELDRAAAQARMQELNQAFGKYMEAASKAEATGLTPLGDTLVTLAAKDPQILNAIAWNVLTIPAIKTRDLAFALKVAEAAVEASGGKEAAILDTYARALFDSGKKAEAIVQQKKAIEVAPAAMKAQMEATLGKYSGK